MRSIVDFTFPNLAQSMGDPAYGLRDRVILTSKVKDALDINRYVMSRMPASSVSMEAYSSDAALEGGSSNSGAPPSSSLFAPDVLHSLTPSGFPPHQLQVVVGAPYVLLRNLNPAAGHCNGTRYVVESIAGGGRLLEARAITGPAQGRTYLIPRILFTTTANDYPFVLRRKQFPFQPAFAMTIHKAQGQTLRVVGLHASNPSTIFTHGQLYVAMSRVGDPDRLRIAVDQPIPSEPNAINNIVYREALI